MSSDHETCGKRKITGDQEDGVGIREVRWALQAVLAFVLHLISNVEPLNVHNQWSDMIDFLLLERSLH